MQPKTSPSPQSAPVNAMPPPDSVAPDLARRLNSPVMPLMSPTTWSVWTAGAAETADANHAPPIPGAHRMRCVLVVPRQASGRANLAEMVRRMPTACLAWGRRPGMSRTKRRGADLTAGSVVGSSADANAPPLARHRHGARSLRAAPTTHTTHPVRTLTVQNPSGAASVRPAVANEARVKPPKTGRTPNARDWHRSSWLGRRGACRGCP
jgi:hypothetical protein